MDKTALFKIGYGLYVLSAHENGFDNGCIVNTVMQAADNPLRLVFSVNKQNKTHDMIVNTGLFAVSCLTESTPFEMFKWYGFQSGRAVNKFVSEAAYTRCENGVLRLNTFANAYMAGKVLSMTDLGSHTLFVAELTEAEVLNNEPSVTYAYYHANIKPKPQVKADEGEKWVCKICGYVHEGPLPSDFICPLCKHPASDFERM
ncbi:MAG: flavin reductase [Clostridia bacterium]|nr:flavin reductase [Clostridia bacterium]